MAREPSTRKRAEDAVHSLAHAWLPSEEVVDVELVEYLRNLIRSGPEDPVAQPGPAEVARCWGPDASNGDKKASITKRHPGLLHRALDGIPPMVISKVSRSVARGRQGYFHSRKNGRTLHFRARLEFELMLLAEVDHTISSFVEQPIQLQYFDQHENPRRHTPDLVVQRGHELEFYEVKWEREASSIGNELRWPQIGAAIASLGFKYSVVTERTIRRQPRKNNVAKIYRFRRARMPDEKVVGDVLRYIGGGAATPSELVRAFPALSADQIYRLVLESILMVNMEAPLDDDANVWVRTIHA